MKTIIILPKKQVRGTISVHPDELIPKNDFPYRLVTF